MRKLFFGGFLVLGLIVAGFIFLIRGCLSQYDERSAITPALFVEKDGKAVLFSLVKYAEATSYSQKGGFVSKSVSTSYYIQTNNPETGAVLSEEKIKHHSDIKHYPVETLGSSAGLAWLFIGEIMAFDPFTLEKKADKEILEAKNPALKGRLPDARQYYQFKQSDNSFLITANDGTFWKLNTATLIATAQEEKEPEDAIEAAVEHIEKLREKNRKAQDSLYHGDHPGKLYAAGKITQREYATYQKRFFASRDSLWKERDSLQQVESLLRRKESATRHLHSAMDNLRRGRQSYQQIKTNQDTVNGQWLGIYSKSEMDKLNDDVYMQTAYDETARRQLYASVYTEEQNGDAKIDKEKIDALSATNFFLQGGFLLDKQTALPVRVDNSRLVVYKDKIGNEGKIIISRIDQPGKIAWTMETGLKEWADWIVTSDRIFIFGTDNTSLSGDECNVLLSVDLKNGTANKYDYFTNK